MRVYESTYILNPGLDEEAVTRLQEKFSDFIKKNGGEIINIENWGKRRMAYEIERTTEGIFVVMRFNSPESLIEELNRSLRLSDDVVKHLIIRLN